MTLDSRRCPEAGVRDAMTDDEFWGHVFAEEGIPDQDDPEPPDAITTDLQVSPCDVCGATDAECGNDVLGRPYVHCGGDD